MILRDLISSWAFSEKYNYAQDLSSFIIELLVLYSTNIIGTCSIQNLIDIGQSVKRLRWCKGVTTELPAIQPSRTSIFFFEKKKKKGHRLWKKKENYRLTHLKVDDSPGTKNIFYQTDYKLKSEILHVLVIFPWLIPLFCRGEGLLYKVLTSICNK